MQYQRRFVKISTNNNSKTVNLKVNSILEQKRIVTEFVYYPMKNLVSITLDTEYKPAISVSISINRKNWSKNGDNLYTRLKKRGVKDEDARLAGYSIDEKENVTKIMSLNDVSDAYDVYEEIHNNRNNKNHHNQILLPVFSDENNTRQIPLLGVLQAKRADEGLVRVIGRIASRSTTYRVILKSEFKCNNPQCGFNAAMPLYPPSPIIPKGLDNTGHFNPTCFRCKTFGSMQVDHTFANAKRIQLDDIDTIDEKFDRLDFIIYGNASSNIIEGEIVEIEGHLLTQKNNNGLLTNVVYSDNPIKSLSQN